MIETHWYDAFIVYVRYGDGKLEIRLGAVCLLVVLVVVWRLAGTVLGRSRDE